MWLSQTEIITFVLATLAVMAIPGVTVSSITGTTLGHGVSAGFSMELGAVLARLSMLAVLGLGLGAVSQFMLAAFDWVKLLGAAYLIWIGIKSIRHPPKFRETDYVPPKFANQVLSGFIVLWSNPKALLFFGAFVPQFIDPAMPLLPQLAFLGAIWIAIVVMTDSAYILLAGGARHLFRGPFADRVGWVSGVILIGAGVWLALQGRPAH